MFWPGWDRFGHPGDDYGGDYADDDDDDDDDHDHDHDHDDDDDHDDHGGDDDAHHYAFVCSESQLWTFKGHLPIT